MKTVSFDTILAHTGQNYDYNLNGVFFHDLELDDPEVYMDAVGKDDVVIIVAVIINSIRDRVAEIVQLILVGAPAVADTGLNVDNLEGGKEAVLDALFQTVCVKRLPKIVDVGNIFRFLRRRGHADLRGRGEVFKNL